MVAMQELPARAGCCRCSVATCSRTRARAARGVRGNARGWRVAVFPTRSSSRSSRSSSSSSARWPRTARPASPRRLAEGARASIAAPVECCQIAKIFPSSSNVSTTTRLYSVLTNAFHTVSSHAIPRDSRARACAPWVWRTPRRSAYERLRAFRRARSSAMMEGATARRIRCARRPARSSTPTSSARSVPSSARLGARDAPPLLRDVALPERPRGQRRGHVPV